MKPATFKDHFSAQAADYARYRPHYPRALFAYLASLCPEHELAWDCATGNGQAAHSLAEHFAQVIATDASADQIANATPHDGVDFHVAPASQSPLAAQSADLITVAHALHWFDHAAFYAEVDRVLKPSGVLAVWTYSLLQFNPTLDAVIKHYYEEVVGSYWPPERRLVEEEYRPIPFPFEEITPPAFSMTLAWSFDELIGYLRTWSATRRFVEDNDDDPVSQIADDLTKAWGDAEKRLAFWTLPLRIGQRHA